MRSALLRSLTALGHKVKSGAGRLSVKDLAVISGEGDGPERGTRLQRLDTSRATSQTGHYVSLMLENLPPGDSLNTPGASMIRLFEDGFELGPGHSAIADVEQIGGGRFSHWGDTLHFSSRDGSCPVTNGREYLILWDDFRVHKDELPVSSLPLGVLLNLQHGIMSYKYRGIDCFKCPFDLALYQQLLWRERPRTIIEIGTWKGGSALWLADLLTTFEIDGHIHSFDIAGPPTWSDERITFHKADAHAIGNAAPASWVGELPRPLLVIEDAGHTASITSAILKHFAPLLRSGEHMIVEDTIIHDMHADHLYNGGPRRALLEFLRVNKDYVIDRSYCDFYGENVTWNVNGYLRRI
jgi:cephalosporin hydroxylase